MTKISNSEVDLKRLKKLYDTQAGRAILDHLASRERNWRVTVIDRLLQNVAREGTQVSRKDGIEVLRELEAARCGTFMTGRRGHSTRFEWTVGMVEVGQAAAGETVSIEPVSGDGDEEEDGITMFEHKFQLRPDLVVVLELPSNLSSSEASRMAEFVKTLPFGVSQ